MLIETLLTQSLEPLTEPPIFDTLSDLSWAATAGYSVRCLFDYLKHVEKQKTIRKGRESDYAAD